MSQLLWGPSRHTCCPKPSRGFPLRPAGPAPLRVSSPQSGLSKPLPELLSLEYSPTPLPPWVPGLDSLPSTPRAPVLSPQTRLSPPRAPRRRRRFLSHTCSRVALSAACSPVNTWVQSLSVRSSSAERPPAVSASGPTRAQDPNAAVATGRLTDSSRAAAAAVRGAAPARVANRTRLCRARSAPSSQSARPLPPVTPPSQAPIGLSTDLP